MKTPHRDLFFFWTPVALLLIGAHLLFRHSVLLLDENIHYQQILISAGLGQGDQVVTTLPVYHHITGSIAALLDSFDPAVLRSISLLYAVAFVVAVSWTARIAHPQDSQLKTAETILLPMVFPLFPLLYVDIFASILPVIALGFFLRRQFLVAGIICIIATVIRQTNLVWLATFFCMLYIQDYGYRLTTANILSHCRQYAVFIAGGIVFILFVLWNGGLVMGGWRGAFESGGLFSANLFFSFLMFFLIFMPRIFLSLPTILGQVRKDTRLLFAGAIFLIAYYAMFEITHEWNLSRAEPPLLRNLILQFIFDHPAAFWLSGILGLAGFWFMLTAKPIIRGSWVLYLFSAIILMTIEHVEPRYHLMLFVGFLLLTRRDEPHIERIQLLWMFATTAWIMWSHYRIWFFL